MVDKVNAKEKGKKDESITRINNLSEEKRRILRFVLRGRYG